MSNTLNIFPTTNADTPVPIPIPFTPLKLTIEISSAVITRIKSNITLTLPNLMSISFDIVKTIPSPGIFTISGAISTLIPSVMTL